MDVFPLLCDGEQVRGWSLRVNYNDGSRGSQTYLLCPSSRILVLRTSSLDAVPNDGGVGTFIVANDEHGELTTEVVDQVAGPV